MSSWWSNPAQALLGGGEEVLGDVVGAVDDGHSPARAIASHRLSAQLVAVAVELAENDRLRQALDGPARALLLDPLARGLPVALQGGGDRLQPGLLFFRLFRKVNPTLFLRLKRRFFK